MITRDTIAEDVAVSGCPEDHVSAMVDQLVYGIRDLIQDAIGALNAIEEQWAEEDRR